MKVIDAIAEIMKREGVQFLSCYPTTPIIEACAEGRHPPLSLPAGARRSRYCRWL